MAKTAQLKEYAKIKKILPEMEASKQVAKIIKIYKKMIKF